MRETELEGEGKKSREIELDAGCGGQRETGKEDGWRADERHRDGAMSLGCRIYISSLFHSASTRAREFLNDLHFLSPPRRFFVPPACQSVAPPFSRRLVTLYLVPSSPPASDSTESHSTCISYASASASFYHLPSTAVSGQLPSPRERYSVRSECLRYS